MQPKTRYNISLELYPFSNFRYKYELGKWVSGGNAESICEKKLSSFHPKSPAIGEFWMAGIVSFKKLRITNNKKKKKGSVSVLMFLNDCFM